MSKQLSVALLSGFGLLAFGCGTGQSHDVNQKSIVQRYQISVEDEAERVSATASFHYENSFGTTLRLTEPSSVEFAGKPMRYQSFLGMSQYHANQEGISSNFMPMQFRYTNNTGEVFTVDAPLPPSLEVLSPRAGTRVWPDQDLVVRVATERLKENEELKACLHAETSTLAAPPLDECLYFRGSSSVMFSREQLEKFGQGGEVSLQISRTHNPSQNNARIHLQLTRTYKSTSLYF